MEQVRSFVAIELPEDIRMALSGLQKDLKRGGDSSVKWVDPRGIHLTLKFLGSVSSTLIPRIEDALTGVAQGVGPFSLEVVGTGVFPHLRNPRVAWVGLAGEIESLLRLQGAVDSALEPLGFVPEARPFSPHLTLARLREDVSPEARQGFGQRLMQAKFPPQGPFQVEALNLMKSQLTPQGAIYSRLASLKLGSSSR